MVLIIKKITRIIPFIIFFFMAQAGADGQLMVMPARSTIEGLQPRTVQVSNLGDKPLYLKVDLVHIDNPGDIPEKKTGIGNVSEPELMANPGKLTLGPGQKRDISLVALKIPAKETLYRLYIVPVSSIKILGNNENEKITAPLTFGVAYGVVVHHLPMAKSQVRAWTHRCISDGIQLSITGNVSIKFNGLNGIPIGGLSHDEKVFPGTPRVFPVKRMKGNADDQPFDIRCP